MMQVILQSDGFVLYVIEKKRIWTGDQEECHYFHEYILICHLVSNISDCFDPVFVLTFTKREY